ncbi:hypothetical protein [Ghiorsea bivora]|uniref:hypothetical protein n=1 Tax=Ghiorsea bivora TaxID=1485545 RepID=UPI00056E001D|nr:hypothetical protein [Ghiorsea bivora]
MFNDVLAVSDNKIAAAFNLAVLRVKHGKEEKFMGGLSIISAKQDLTLMLSVCQGRLCCFAEK